MLNVVNNWAEVVTLNSIGLSILVFDLNPAQQVVEMFLTLVLIAYTSIKIYKSLKDGKKKTD